MAKKDYSKAVQEASESYVTGLENAGQAVAQGMTEAGNQQLADLAAADKARQAAYNDAQKLYQQRMDEGLTSFADIVSGGNARIAQAQAESDAELAASRRAARWTGATELASSIANLIAVGGNNAVSQQYRPYSQDWMRKADQDARYNRARIDNLRERQKAMQMQLANLRMGNAERALQMERERANAAYQHGLATAQTRYQTSVTPLNIQMQTAKEAGQARVQGAAQVANVGLHERQLAQSAAQHAAQMKETKRYHDNQLEIARAKAARGTGSGSGSKGSNLSLKIRQGDHDVTLNMDEKTYQNALKRGRPDLKKDVLAMVQKVNPAVSSWEDIEKASRDKKVRDKDGNKVDNPLYGSELSNIASILSRSSDTYSDEDWAAIAGFAEGNYDVTENFNNHLFKVSKGGYDWGADKEETPEPEKEETPEPEKEETPSESEKKQESNSIDKEFDV